MSSAVPKFATLAAKLEWRGLVKQTTGKEALSRLLEERPVTFYLGIDPTGPSLHAGHLVGLLAMAHLQRAGHRPVLLIGGATARVGDPSDKDDMRPLLPVETVARNAALMKEQVGRFIDLQRTIIVDNAAWLAGLGYLDFLRDIGRHFSVNRMLGFEAYRRRLQTGLSFLEFNYLLLQAYDYLVLHREHGCLLQIGGDDQWANILAGVDLIRRVEQAEAHALTWPLVTTADGKKMGKTAAGALFLDPALVSPYQFYQYWINVPDADAPKLLALLTLLPEAEVVELSRLRDQAIMAAKERLAMELTAMVHGADEARARARNEPGAVRRGRRAPRRRARRPRLHAEREAGGNRAGGGDSGGRSVRAQLPVCVQERCPAAHSAGWGARRGHAAHQPRGAHRTR